MTTPDPLTLEAMREYDLTPEQWGDIPQSRQWELREEARVNLEAKQAWDNLRDAIYAALGIPRIAEWLARVLEGRKGK